MEKADGGAMVGDKKAKHCGLQALTLELLGKRAADATLCPSEVARAAAAAAGTDDWRSEMAAVHKAVAGLVGEGLVRLSWKGEDRMPGEGPYRIGRLCKAARDG